MLAPDDIEPILNGLKEFYFTVRCADRVAYAGKTIRIYPINENFQKLQEISKDVAALGVSGNKWYAERAGIISNVVSTFQKYSVLFSAARTVLESTDDQKVVLATLNSLIGKVEENIRQTRKAEEAFSDYLTQSKKAVEKLEKGIETSWEQLALSESNMVVISNQICRVQSQIEALDKDASLNFLDSQTVNDCRSVCTQTASICYSLVVNGLSMPYLSVGVLAFTFGKSIYQIVQNAGQFEKEVEKLQELSQKLSLEQKTLVQTKMLLRTLYMLHEMVKEQYNSLEQMIVFWKNEKRNLETVQSNITCMKGYSKENPEVMQVPIADVVWNMLGQTAENILVWLNESTGTGTEEKLEVAI